MQWQIRDGPFTGNLLAWIYERGLIDRAIGLRRNTLTVVCYHRIGALAPVPTASFIPNISALPETFERQIDYLCKHFTPIAASELSQFIDRPHRLPPRPVLITFDDGYKDNSDFAWPILRKRGIPAVIFLTTDHIGTDRPFIWDMAAYCFHNTECAFADVPLLGPTYFRTLADRDNATETWLMRSKALPASERWPAAEAMRKSLRVVVPDAAFSGLYLSWDDVRRMASEGLEFGGHTRTHPILSKMPLGEARAEIRGSRERIGAELGRPPLSFAYPNGSTADFDRELERAVRDAGYSIAFSLAPGPSSFAEIRRNPMAIRRIYIGFNDNMPRFAAKLTGAYRLRVLMQQYSSRQRTDRRQAALY